MDTVQYAGVGFANILLVGTVYAASALQAQLPRLFDFTRSTSLAPFGLACCGLSIGVVLCTSLLYRSAAHHVAAQGTLLYGTGVALAGYSIIYQISIILFIGCFLAGIGVGITYLGVVLLLGGLFPNQALARSAIGPLGFSSGAAICFGLEKYLDFGSLEASELGSHIILGGITCLTVGILTLALMSSSSASHLEGSHPTGCDPARKFFSVLLFFNALPGMTLFSALYPILQPHVNQEHMCFLPYGMVALGLGGILSPALNGILGGRNTFALLFILRGLLLVAAAKFNNAWLLGGTFITVLFSHGAGFSLLPGLVKAKTKSPQAFSQDYGKVLVSWGLSGVAGCLLNVLTLFYTDGQARLSVSLGFLILSVGIVCSSVQEF